MPHGLPRCLPPGRTPFVLGCTHFPFAAGAIRRGGGRDSTSCAAARAPRATQRRLPEGAAAGGAGEGSVTIENSLDSPAILALSRQLLHAPIFPGRESFDK